MSVVSLVVAPMAVVFTLLRISSAADATFLPLPPPRPAVAKAISRWWALGPAFPATVHAMSITTIASATKAALFQRRSDNNNDARGML